MATNLKRIIGRITDLKELRELKLAIGAREKLLADRQYAERVVEAWARVADWKIGDTLYVCSGGTFIGGPFQRGDSMKLTHIQPKAKRVWVQFGADNKPYWFGAQGILRYDLRTTATEKPIDPEHRKSIDRIAGRLFGDNKQMVAA